MRRAARIDENQPALVEMLRALGAKVCSIAPLGDGKPDLLCGYHGVLFLLEVKDGSKPPSKQQLTEKEQAFHEEWRDYPLFIVNSEQQLLALLHRMRNA